ncbi:MAG: M23 family metallopeptidase [Tannerella sp.]|nr:M23 family metallopeptidase [Tannerella sp.]
MKKKRKKFLLIIAVIFVAGLLLPQNFRMPVEGVGRAGYNQESFWYYPWGTSIVHHGVDIFAKKGTAVRSSTWGWVVPVPETPKGGKSVWILGPKWRFHYYAHLDRVDVKPFRFVSHKTQIGTVGNTGNAATTPAHLHYGVITAVPYPWLWDKDRLGWRKMFYLNPVKYLNEATK